MKVYNTPKIVKISISPKEAYMSYCIAKTGGALYGSGGFPLCPASGIDNSFSAGDGCYEGQNAPIID